MLTADEMMDFEEVIDGLLAQLQTELESSRVNTAAVAPDNAIGRVSRMDSILSQEVAKAMVASKQERVMQLHAARKRLDEGSFGLCASCFQDIEMDRLQAAPESLLCQTCAQKRR